VLFTRWRSYPWLIVGVTCIGAFMGQVDASIVQLALPTLGRVFDCTLESVSWVALAYLLGVAAFLPIFAQLCQMFGRKLLYIIGFVVFTGASALCGFAPDLATLIAFRFLQGFGGAMLAANSMALVVTSTDKSLRARALGVYAGAQAVGISAGPVIGGLLGALGWPWVFWMNVPFGLILIVAGCWCFGHARQGSSQRSTGAALSARAGSDVCRLALNQVSACGQPRQRFSVGWRRDRAHFSVRQTGKQS
jgi:MFS family permease